MASPMADVENRMGLQPVEELLEQRRHLVEKVATLRAQFGPGGSWDALRKIEKERIKAACRAQALRDKVKVTEGFLEEQAYSHPDYVDFVTSATAERAAWIRLEAEIQEIDFIINRGQSVARFVSMERTL